MKHSNTVEHYISRCKASQHIALEKFQSLNEEQLNWKPNEKSWSIAQCLNHLIVSNEMYFPVFEAVFNNRYKSKWYQQSALINKFWAKQIILMTTSEPIRKTKNPPAFKPSSSRLPVITVTQFASHCDILISFYELLKNKPLDEIPMSSPAAAFITYTLADALLILTQHMERHINQSLRVMNTDGFPK